MRYLYKDHFKDVEGYCMHRCKQIVNEHTQVQVWYYRGQYKGYSYVLKVMRTCRPSNSYQSIPFYIIYNMLKKAKQDVDTKYHNEGEYIGGIKDSIYDCMYYLSNLE